MVSSSDTAKQIQFSSLKQDAAEAAFKARHSFGSSDAFRQIFDGIEKSAKAVDPAKDNAPETVKSDVNTKVHKHRHSHCTKHDDKSSNCDTDDKHDDKDLNPQKADKALSEKHTHINKAKTTTTECDNKKCEEDKSAEAVESSDETDDTQSAAAADSTEPSEHTVCDEGDEFFPVMVNTLASDQVEPHDVVLDGAGVEATAGDEVLSIEAQGTIDTTAPNATEILPLLVANVQLGLKADANKGGAPDTKSTTPNIGEFKKAVIAPQKPELEKTAAAPNDQNANDAFSAAIEATAEPAPDTQQDTQAETAHENLKNKRAATQAANEKHEAHIELLQGKSSASETHPAAGDRAISVALKASDSPAPTHNGSAGGGSPIASKGAAPAAVTTSLEALHSIQGDNVTFAGTLRSTKEAQASLMTPHEQVAVQLNRMVKSGISQYDLQLHPADLGRIDIRLEIKKDGAVQATITADNQQTFDMLQKDSRSLERALQQAGLQTDSGSLSFNLRGDGQSQAQQHAQNNNGHPWNKWMEKTLPEEAVQSKVLSFDVASGNGRIDLRI